MPKKVTNTTMSYQALTQKLEEAMAKLQDPEIAVDDAVACYEDAMKLIVQLENHLELAENRVREIRTKFANG